MALCVHEAWNTFFINVLDDFIQLLLDAFSQDQFHGFGMGPFRNVLGQRPFLLRELMAVNPLSLFDRFDSDDKCRKCLEDLR